MVQGNQERIVSGGSDCDNGGGGHGVKRGRNIRAEFPESDSDDSSSDSEDKEGLAGELCCGEVCTPGCIDRG